MTLIIEQLGSDRQDAFASIWIPWLRHSAGFEPQPEDLEAMADPAAYYGRTGGAAFVAVLDRQVGGAVAVKGLGAAGGEFCKLIVTEAARGTGAGRALIEGCIEHCLATGKPTLYLQSFRKLEVALSLYRGMGFQDCPAPQEMTVLARTEVIMSKRIY